jgi:hypothetical protein
MNATLKSFDIEYTLLCEDVRREDNGKLLLIGMFANSILLPSFPIGLRLRVVVRIHPKVHECPLNFRIAMDNKGERRPR